MLYVFASVARSQERTAGIRDMRHDRHVQTEDLATSHPRNCARVCGKHRFLV